MDASIHPLDLDLIRDLGDRARALFDAVTLRVYTAALVGRQTQRAPFGAHRETPLPFGTPERVAFNDSKDRALLTYVDVNAPVPVSVVYSSSSDSGSTNFGAQLNQAGGVPPNTFVLRPGEQLFARRLTPGPGFSVVATTEWY